MHPESVKSFVDIDIKNNIIAILYQKSTAGFAIAKVDFATCSIKILSKNYVRSGLRVQKILPIDYSWYVLIYGERQVQDSKDVV